MWRIILPGLLTISQIASVEAQLGSDPKAFVHADSLRGTIGPYRDWWDVTYYDVTVRPDLANRSIVGTTAIAFQAVAVGQRMQVDLQQPLVVDSITTEVSTYRDGVILVEDQRIPFERAAHVIWIDEFRAMPVGGASTIRIHYHGAPRSARHPPWDGGWIWKTDRNGNPWISVACQGLGASVWYPCKDHQGDEPEGAALHIIVPDTLVAVGNGKLLSVMNNRNGTQTWNWTVTSPINTYNLVPYIGKYTHISGKYVGTSGPLDVDHWVLAYNGDVALDHFIQVTPMLACFEDWFGPYPFYSDGYKLVEAPHLGMEHQSAIAYGNGFQNGYLGHDRSRTGHGLEWDYIIVHESGHEWFGNSITSLDIADMWIHEGFACYSETIFTECQQGRNAAEEYLIGLRNGIVNDRPVIGPYGVNKEGSTDMYNKGANLIHTIRHIMANDSIFKAMLREMNIRYYHSVVTSAEIESFIDSCTAVDLKPVFDQYLRTTSVPVLEWGVRKGRFWSRWTNCIDGFVMPIGIIINGDRKELMNCTSEWKSAPKKYRRKASISIDENWYINERKVAGSELKSLSPTAYGPIGLTF